MSSYKPARVLWNLTASNATPTLTGAATTSSPLISIGDVTDVWLAVNVTGTPTGTSPTLDVGLDVQDADGNWYPTVVKITQITGNAGRGSAYAGLHMPIVASNSAAIVLPATARVTWTLGGTTPAYPQTSICLYGR